MEVFFPQGYILCHFEERREGWAFMNTREFFFVIGPTRTLLSPPWIGLIGRSLLVARQEVHCAVNGVKFCGRDARLLTHQNRQLSAPARLLMAHILKKTYKGNVGLL